MWYEDAKQHVLAFGERTLNVAAARRSCDSEGDCETEALLATLGSVVWFRVDGFPWFRVCVHPAQQGRVLHFLVALGEVVWAVLCMTDPLKVQPASRLHAVELC